MSTLLPVDEALAQVLAQLDRLPGEPVPLGAAWGRVLAQPVTSETDLPPFGNSAMDGYAIHCADLCDAASDRPVVLPLAAEILAAPGSPSALAAGTTARVMTGAPVPPGADAVVPLEEIELGDDGVAFRAPVALGQHVRPRGADVRTGEVVVPAGTVLGGGELAVLGAVGAATVEVVRRPRAVVLTTGDELVDIGAELGPGQIRDTSSVVMPALLTAAGAEVVGTSRAEDELEALVARLETLPACDLVLTCGGVSVGARDFVKPALERAGQVLFWRVAMKPGKPLLCGRLGHALFFGLPGNPVSSMVGFEVFVKPAIRRLLGLDGSGRVTFRACLTADLRSDPARREYVRARLSAGEDGWSAEPTGNQSSGRLRSMLGADGYVVVPVGTGRLSAGQQVTVEWLPGGMS